MIPCLLQIAKNTDIDKSKFHERALKEAMRMRNSNLIYLVIIHML